MSTKIINNYNSHIPKTRTDSFRELISSGQLSDLKKICVHLLKEHYTKGLTRPEISILIDKPEHSLTAALKILCNEKIIFVSGVRLNPNSRRNNQVYKLVGNEK